jgi:hypothetical protein
MDPRGTLENLDRICRKLRILGAHVFNPGLLNCAHCGKRVATIREVIMHEETDGVRLCRSCFELVLKKWAEDFPVNNFDEYLE